ncbi:hypothetical protein ACJMK2_014836 [Sinanodonta woodiana]|uniref:Uncharacterized protein n=1 Tax=Sinanodonta woodiana TaxID=1069815 RepID=A0ABD3V1U6_SINWO
MTAEQIASAYGCTDVKKILSEQKNKFNDVDEEIDTFHPLHTGIERNGFGLIPITLAAYKNTFHPKKIDPRMSVSSVLREIFNDLTISHSRWIEVRNKISDFIYVVCEKSAKAVKECSYRKEFYRQIINAYTEESTFLYTYMNTALRRQREYNYKPSAIDLAMGPYVVMYQMLLLFWDELRRDNTKTYRTMLLTEKDMEKISGWGPIYMVSLCLIHCGPFKSHTIP